MYILNLFKKMLFKKEQPIQTEQSNLFPKTKLIEGENLTTEQTMLNKKMTDGICVTKVSIPDTYCGQKK